MAMDYYCVDFLVAVAVAVVPSRFDRFVVVDWPEAEGNSPTVKSSLPSSSSLFGEV